MSHDITKEANDDTYLALGVDDLHDSRPLFPNLCEIKHSVTVIETYSASQ